MNRLPLGWSILWSRWWRILTLTGGPRLPSGLLTGRLLLTGGSWLTGGRLTRRLLLSRWSKVAGRHWRCRLSLLGSLLLPGRLLGLLLTSRLRLLLGWWRCVFFGWGRHLCYPSFIVDGESCHNSGGPKTFELFELK